MTEDAYQLLRRIGLPAHIQADPSIKQTPVLTNLAFKNKIGLYYLATVQASSSDPLLQKDIADLKQRQKKVHDLAAFLSKLFDDLGITYSVMKTLKPFPYVGSDVDVLIKSPDHFSKAIKALIQNNFQMMGHDLFSATLLKADFDVYVDLQLELSVSGLPYLPKNLIIQNTKTVNVNGTSVTTLADFAEATVTACHCYYKEHMYTLADFYTTTFYVNDQTWEKFCELATTTNNIVAITALLLWTRRVAYEAFGIRLKGVEKALKKLHPSVESNLVANSNLSFPQIFPKSLVVLGVAGKVVQDHYTRSSLPRALQTSASRRQFRILVEHFKRESY